jgi:hypothetical protein
MIDIHRRPVEFPDLYEVHSKLADARHPMGASVTHITHAWRWRKVDERMGDGYSRRKRIRQRAAKRVPIVFDEYMSPSDERRVSRTVPPSHKGYAA